MSALRVILNSAAPGRPGDYERQQGHAHGYPSCCIEAFVNDVLNDRRPFQLRGNLPDGRVPCRRCKNA